MTQPVEKHLRVSCNGWNSYRVEPLPCICSANVFLGYVHIQGGSVPHIAEDPSLGTVVDKD